MPGRDQQTKHEVTSLDFLDINACPNEKDTEKKLKKGITWGQNRHSNDQIFAMNQKRKKKFCSFA